MVIKRDLGMGHWDTYRRARNVLNAIMKDEDGRAKMERKVNVDLPGK